MYILMLSSAPELSSVVCEYSVLMNNHKANHNHSTNESVYNAALSHSS